MFSGTRKLGESQEMDEDVQDMDEGSDIDFITTNYMSPDSGYPTQRISNYDEHLVQHQTLNGVGQSRMAAPFLRNFLSKMMQPQARIPYGTPRRDSGAVTLTPRTAPQRGWGRLPSMLEKVRERVPYWGNAFRATMR